MWNKDKEKFEVSVEERWCDMQFRQPDDWTKEFVVGPGQRLVIPSETGKVSWFGGPDDDGMADEEDVSLLPGQLGHNLDPNGFYCAMRWRIRERFVHLDRWRWSTMSIYVATLDFRRIVVCRPVDWGPNPRTGRACDLSPGALKYLGLKTDQTARFGISQSRRPFGPVPTGSE
jgi:hypothetical protein